MAAALLARAERRAAAVGPRCVRMRVDFHLLHCFFIYCARRRRTVFEYIVQHFYCIYVNYMLLFKTLSVTVSTSVVSVWFRWLLPSGVNNGLLSYKDKLALFVDAFACFMCLYFNGFILFNERVGVNFLDFVIGLRFFPFRIVHRLREVLIIYHVRGYVLFISTSSLSYQTVLLLIK